MEENEKSRSATVIKDADGNSIVMINDIRFKGKRSINWDEVKKYIEEFVGDDYTIAETSDVVYIGADLPDEYTGSKYTESLRGANAKAKANASQGIPELLSIAKGKYFRENNARKHKKNAKFGWYRYDSRFALPVYGDDNEVERYNVFHASMLIRCANDKKMYLYDIIDIKKETSTSFS
jgi:hypothetical protein